MNPKQQAAEAAINFLQNNMVVGLGTGSTADFFLSALGQAIRTGKLTGIRGVPTSVQSERRAGQLGIPVVSLEYCPSPDVTVDGADEVGPGLALIKGLGGALLREKIVAQATKRMIIIADGSKVVSKLGTRSPLPVEVVPFSHSTHLAFFRSLGAQATIRRNAEGAIFVTDNGNYIYDCRFDGIDDPEKLERALKSRAGVVETGLFIKIAKLALVSDGNQVTEKAE